MRTVFPKVLIELKPSRIAGIGVFATTGVGERQRLAEGISESDYRRLISWTHFCEYDADIREKIDAFCIGTPEGFLPPDDLDFNRLSIEWYLNHSCDGNVGFSKDGDFVARRRIGKGEELVYDYGLAESNPRFRMVCSCGSTNCRKIVTGNDWKDPIFREHNLNCMLPRLRRPMDSRVSKPTRARQVAARNR
jgi:SET domain